MKRQFVMVLSCFPLLVACDGPDLSCSSSETESLVIQLLKKSDVPQIAAMMSKVEIRLDNIRTTDKKSNALTCAADVLMTVQDTKAQIPSVSTIYKVEKTDDGRLYVTLLN